MTLFANSTQFCGDICLGEELRHPIKTLFTFFFIVVDRNMMETNVSDKIKQKQMNLCIV